MDCSQLNCFIDRIFDIGVVQFGTFALKSGVISPVYIDFRLLMSHPSLLAEASRLLLVKMERTIPMTYYDVLCGVPYAALPIATQLSVSSNRPMIMQRKQTKDHGSGKKIEGIFSPGMKCLIVEDVITSGNSIMETATDLRMAGLNVEHTVVLLNREQGGEDNVKTQGITLHSLLTFKVLLSRLESTCKISQNVLEEVVNFLFKSQICLNSSPASNQINQNKHKAQNEKYTMQRNLNSRLNEVTHPIAKRLLNIIQTKHTNLALAADLSNSTEVLAIAKELGPYICLIKLHIDALDDIYVNTNFITELKNIAKSENFLLCEDRKLADIGSTVAHQYQQLMWADIVTVHTLPGPGILEAIRSVIKAKNLEESHGCLLIVEMSSEGNLITLDYSQKSVNMALEFKDIVVGIICQIRHENVSCFLSLTPGVRIGVDTDSFDQRYTDPTTVMLERGTDIVIVGRGILQAKIRSEAAKLYRDKAFEIFT